MTDTTEPSPPEPAENVWDRQPNETARQYDAFKKYRDMGMTRSLSKAAKELGLATDTLKQYSAKNSWVMRCVAFDAEQDRQDSLWLQDERKKAVVRHVKQAQALTNKWLTSLAEIAMTSLTPAEVIRYAEVSTKMEREALQFERTLNVHVSMEDDVAALSPEDTRVRLLQLRAELDERLAEMEADDAGSAG